MTKTEITALLVKELPASHARTAEQAYGEWWVNQRANGGLRLTPRGFEILVDILQLEHYTMQVDLKDVDLRLVIMLDKRLKMPYYLERKHKAKNIEVVFFGAKEATLALLCENVRTFVTGLNNRTQR